MNQDKLREEAEEAYKKIDDGTGFYMGDTYFIDGYIEGAKARQKEIERLKEKLDYSKMFHCPNFVTTDNGYIACNLDKHLLKKELDEAVELLERVYPVIVKYKYISAIEERMADVKWSIDWQEKVNSILAKVKRG
jgi:hypothetical protein